MKKETTVEAKVPDDGITMTDRMLERLEELRKEIEAGTVRAYAFVACRKKLEAADAPKASLITCWVGTSDPFEMSGAIHFLDSRYSVECLSLEVLDGFRKN